jgi:nucleotide-binding universal stress UspA family protein
MKRNDVIDAPQAPPTERFFQKGARRILIPLDLVRGTIDPLLFVQGIGAESPVSATLLHVVSLNVGVTERRVYQELCSEANAALCKLARLFFGDDMETRVSVRIGRPHEQIIQEALSAGSELIILSAGKPNSWARLLAWGTTERVVRSAPCATLILPRKNPVGAAFPSVSAQEMQEMRWSRSPRESIASEPSNRIQNGCAGRGH